MKYQSEKYFSSENEKDQLNNSKNSFEFIYQLTIKFKGLFSNLIGNITKKNTSEEKKESSRGPKRIEASEKSGNCSANETTEHYKDIRILLDTIKKFKEAISLIKYSYLNLKKLGFFVENNEGETIFKLIKSTNDAITYLEDRINPIKHLISNYDINIAYKVLKGVFDAVKYLKDQMKNLEHSSSNSTNVTDIDSQILSKRDTKSNKKIEADRIYDNIEFYKKSNIKEYTKYLCIDIGMYVLEVFADTDEYFLDTDESPIEITKNYNLLHKWLSKCSDRINKFLDTISDSKKLVINYFQSLIRFIRRKPISLYRCYNTYSSKHDLTDQEYKVIVDLPDSNTNSKKWGILSLLSFYKKYNNASKVKKNKKIQGRTINPKEKTDKFINSAQNKLKCYQNLSDNENSIVNGYYLSCNKKNYSYPAKKNN